MSSNVLQPDASLLCKLGSLAVHVEEALSTTGHALDVSACKGIIADPEVRYWLSGMDELALLPVKR